MSVVHLCQLRKPNRSQLDETRSDAKIVWRRCHLFTCLTAYRESCQELEPTSSQLSCLYSTGRGAARCTAFICEDFVFCDRWDSGELRMPGHLYRVSSARKLINDELEPHSARVKRKMTPGIKYFWLFSFFFLLLSASVIAASSCHHLK